MTTAILMTDSENKIQKKDSPNLSYRIRIESGGQFKLISTFSKG